MVLAARPLAGFGHGRLHAPNLPQNAGKYDPETLRRINTGADVSVRDYVAKLHELELLRRSALEIFKDVDVIVTPATPVPPPLVAELQADMSRLRERELMMLRNTRPFNVLGLPAISVPCGETSAGLPVGLQIAGPAGRDAQVLGFARAFESHDPAEGRRQADGSRPTGW